MNSSMRRDSILQTIKQSEKPCSASSLAAQFHVSRQIVVGDIALLRASGVNIIATPRGYVMEDISLDSMTYAIAVVHKEEDLKEELYTIVDHGGTIVDVIVEHPLYGQLSGQLHITSRYDADQFLSNVKNNQAIPLSKLTNGLHLHTIKCKDEDTHQRIIQALKEKGFLYEKS
ncbi:MAG: transcription repressor NadR [Longicatena sp.]